jgi:hypothetical protein
LYRTSPQYKHPPQSRDKKARPRLHVKSTVKEKHGNYSQKHLSATLPGVLPVRANQGGLILTLPLACIFSVRQKNSGLPPPVFLTFPTNSNTGLFSPTVIGS